MVYAPIILNCSSVVKAKFAKPVGEIMNKMGWPANPRDAYQRHERRRIEFRNRAQALFDRSKS